MLEYFTKKEQENRVSEYISTPSESTHQPKPPTENRVVDGSTV